MTLVMVLVCPGVPPVAAVLTHGTGVQDEWSETALVARVETLVTEAIAIDAALSTAVAGAGPAGANVGDVVAVVAGGTGAHARGDGALPPPRGVPLPEEADVAWLARWLLAVRLTPSTRPALAT